MKRLLFACSLGLLAAACDMSDPALMDADSNLETALVDLGGGPVEVSYEVIDGQAVFQGDMILGPVEQVRAGKLAIVDRHSIDPDAPVAASAIAHFRSWPDGRVPFRIAAGFSDTQLDRIRAAIDHWNSETIVRLVPASGDEHHVLFRPVKSGCSANIGYNTFWDQNINLSPGCGTGAIVHEIGHAVGLYHEQSRADRDEHVVINWDAITAGQEHNFDKYPWHDGMDVGPYDTGSIMHYGSWDFAEGALPTIVRAGCNPDSQFQPLRCVINANRTRLSDLDKAGVTRLVTGDPLKFRLRNEHNGRCLRPSGGSRAANTDLGTSTCRNQGDQWYTWKIPGLSGELVINAHSRLCLSQESGSDDMEQVPCTRSARARYDFTDSGWFLGERLRRIGTSRCVRKTDADWRAFLSGTCDNTATRRWFRDWL